jgi:hypothetical protein
MSAIDVPEIIAIAHCINALERRSKANASQLVSKINSKHHEFGRINCNARRQSKGLARKIKKNRKNVINDESPLLSKLAKKVLSEEYILSDDEACLDGSRKIHYWRNNTIIVHRLRKQTSKIRRAQRSNKVT